MCQALEHYLPGTTQKPGHGASSLWIEGDPALDTRKLHVAAAAESILIEPGDIHFQSEDPPLNYFRLGYSSIANDQIEPGIKHLAKIIHGLL